MKHRAITIGLLAAVLLCPLLTNAKDFNLCNVGSDRQLFIDQAFFDNARNVGLVLHPPRKTNEQLVQYDKPWESATLNWFNVLRDKGVIDKEAQFRMWYECYDVPGWPTADDTSFCYAESRDGIHWTKPELGLFEYQGSKKNNILFRQIGAGDHRSRVHGTGVFIDPSAPPEARYKAVSQGQFQGATPPQRIAGMVSPDGLHWTRLPARICDLFADSQYSGFWDAGLNKYVIYGRVAGNIGRAESADFAHFPALELVLTVDERDPPNSNLYNSAVLKYPGAANVYMMFPSLYRRDPSIDTLDIRLAVSRDGINWTYPDQGNAFIPLGAPGTWDSGSLYMGQGVIDMGDETWLYYSGSPLRHQESELDNLTKTKQPRAFSRVVTRRDRFVSVDGGPGGGWFVTPPLQFTGNRLKLNVNVHSGGTIRVALLDEEGKPLPGFTLDDCLPIEGDQLDATVRWKGGADVGSRAKQPTRMRIELRDASLFGFQFAVAEPSGTPAARHFRLWQIPGQSERNVMMSYVIQTPQGHVVVIDGGWEADGPYLKEFLRNLGGRVDTWFITHQHDDHIGALTATLREPEGVQIDRIYGSPLSDEWIKQHEPDQLAAAQALNSAASSCGKPIVRAKLGEKLEIDGLEFEVLTVSDEAIHDSNNFMNNQCMVLRLATPAVSILFLADLGEQAGERLLAGPLGGKHLRSDYVQMAHHGQRGVNRKFYEAIGATQALWPTPRWLYDVSDAPMKATFNTAEVRQWMKDLHVEQNYVAKDGLIELSLPVTR